MLAARVSWCRFADSSSMGRLLLVLAHPVPPRPLLGLGSFVCFLFLLECVESEFLGYIFYCLSSPRGFSS